MSSLAKPDEQPHFDGSDMRMMHNMFRREFALMPGLVGGVAAGDHDRAQIIGDHMEAVIAVLHGHHTHEDENIWPLLLDRCGESVASLVELMQGQHRQVATLLHQVDEDLSIWREGVTVESGEALADILDRLIPALKEHLSGEEDRVVPRMEQHITVAEWHAPMGGELAAFSAQLPLAIGLLMYEGDPHSIDQAIASMPADARPVIRQQAAKTFADHSQRVHGTATPPRSTQL
ncbi:MAG TPA: hemerythrin domain-containing protein [Mycobacterium sp.]|nr:hemerythrin domain-containing protein [Mycobacterium sp.]